MKTITFVTQSVKKVLEAERILGMKLDHHKLDLPEIQAVSIEELIEHKARYAYEALGQKPVMVEDTGLFIEAWNGLPGALVKWFIDTVGVSGICQMLRDFPDRRAVAKTVLAIYDGRLSTFLGEVQGHIADIPAGDKGFGWDPIFIPDDAAKTFAEMEPDEKDTYSMRRLALEKMRATYGKPAST